MAKKKAKVENSTELEQTENESTPELEQTEELKQTENDEAQQTTVQTVQTPEPEVRSKFTGGAFANFFINLAAKFVILITLGILYPFMVTWKEKWMAKHTYINGRQLEFDGNGFQFWGRYMLWWLLSVVTLGVYYVVFMSVGVAKWRTKHLHYADTPADKRESYFDGHWYQLLGVKMLSWLVVIETLGIAALWSICFKQRWTCSHQVIDGQRLSFNGGGLQLFGKYLLWMLLTIITLGIYGFWFLISVKKWTIYHTNNNGTAEREKITHEEKKELVIIALPFLALLGYSISKAFVGIEAGVAQMMLLDVTMLFGPLILLTGIVRVVKNKAAHKTTTFGVTMMAIGWMFVIITGLLALLIK